MMGTIKEIGKRVYNLSNPRERRRYYVFLLRSMFHGNALRQLVEFFQTDELRREIFQRQAFPIEQVTRAFFYNKSTFAERVKLVREHYEILEAKLQPEAFVNLGDCDYKGLTIYTHDFDGQEMVVSLKFEAGQRKEGLLSVIMKLDGKPLYQIIFWLAKDKAGQEALWIGAMQGPNMDHAKDVVKKMTKACFGCRTKNLILHMLQTMVRALCLQKIYAVSNYGYYANNHVRSDRKLKTNFGDFWEEAGGCVTEDNRFYELPLEEKRKTYEEIPTRKRAVYRKRFAFLDEVDEEITAAIKAVLKR